MSIYRYSGSSPIAEARFHTVDGRAPVALLRADDAVDGAQLLTLRKAIAAKGWQAFPVFAYGHEQLQVSGFKHPVELRALLAARQLIAGEPQIAVEEIDLESKNGWFERRKLQIAGGLNAIGDVSLFAGGVGGKDHLFTAAGALYSGGALVLGVYGNVKTDRQLREVAQDTAEFLRMRMGGLASHLSASSVLSQKDTSGFHQLENYLYRHPADIMLGAYTAGAAAMLGSGILQKNSSRIYYGIWSLAVKTASFLMPEKKSNGQEKEVSSPHSIGEAVNWIRDKPLRLFGYGSMITEFLLARSSWKDFKNPDVKTKRKGGFGLFTAGAYVLSDMLMATSSKDPSNADGKFNDDQRRQLEAMTAEVVAQAPEPQRAQLANDVGGFLAKRAEVKGSQAEIASAILAQAEHLSKSRWVARTAVAEDALNMTQAVR